MVSAHELARGHERLRALVEFVQGEGWHVERTQDGRLRFTKAGCATICTGSTASGQRVSSNARGEGCRTRRERCAARIRDGREGAHG